MNDYCVLYDHDGCRLSMAKVTDAIELNANRWLNNEPPLGVVRMWLERDQASQFINSYGPYMAQRLQRREAQPQVATTGVPA